MTDFKPGDIVVHKVIPGEFVVISRETEKYQIRSSKDEYKYAYGFELSYPQPLSVSEY